MDIKDLAGIYVITMIIISLFACVALPVVTKFPQCLFSPEIHLWNWLDGNDVTTIGKTVFFIITLPIFGFVYVIYFVVIGAAFTIVLLISLFLTIFTNSERGGDENFMEKKILDVTCGARSMWFNKHHPAAVYCDKRREQYHHLWKSSENCTLDINPDVVCDFTDLPFPDNSFPLVVFDPPHLTGAKETAWLVKKYGKLDENWPQMIHDGFQECMRVLKPDGVLIFKWSEYDIPAAEVWKAIGQKPLFGHHSGKQSRTFWACFMKLEEMEMLDGMECEDT